MNMYRHFPAACVLTFLLTAGAVPPVDAPTAPQREDIVDTIKKTFKVRPGGTIEIDADRGNVEIRSGGNDDVRIEVIRMLEVESKEEAKRVLEAHALEFSNKDDVVVIMSRFDRDRVSWWRQRNRFRVRIVVQVPDEFDAEVSTGAGNVSIDNIKGEIDIRTGAGNVTLGDIDGPVDIRSGSGNVFVDSAAGGVEVKTGTGNVSLHDVRGSLEVSTGAGNVDARITRQPESDSVLESGAGNVTVFLADDIGVEVDAVARVGSCTTDFPLKVVGKWMKKSFAGDVNGGGPDLVMRSGVGNVTLKRL